MRKSRLSERELAAWKRHSEVGHPKGYDGPCWGPLARDYEYVDAQIAAAQGSTEGPQPRDE